MKAGLVTAAYGAALGRLRSGREATGTVILVADIGEEVDSPDGISRVLDSGITADYGISAEATNLETKIGHRGKVEFEITVRGEPAHASAPTRGVNAIDRMATVLIALAQHTSSLTSDPILGTASQSVIDIEASPGGGVAVVPETCTIRLDRRFHSGESPDSCGSGLRSLIGSALDDPEGDSWVVEQVNLYPLLLTPPEHPLVEAAQEARRQVLGPAPVSAWQFGVNGTFMARAGIPTIGFGPGNEVWAHSPEEHVLVGDLTDAAEVYAGLISRLWSQA